MNSDQVKFFINNYIVNKYDHVILSELLTNSNSYVVTSNLINFKDLYIRFYGNYMTIMGKNNIISILNILSDPISNHDQSIQSLVFIVQYTDDNIKKILKIIDEVALL